MLRNFRRDAAIRWLRHDGHADISDAVLKLI